MPSLLARAWPTSIRGTADEFARFLGIPRRQISRLTWETLSDLVSDRFNLQPLGGGVKFPGSSLECKTFRFQLPNRARWWRAGVPKGGAEISKASEAMRTVNGTGKTLDEAALAAVIVLWELTYLRASQANYDA